MLPPADFVRGWLSATFAILALITLSPIPVVYVITIVGTIGLFSYGFARQRELTSAEESV